MAFITLTRTELIPSIDYPIISVSSLTHVHNKIVVFADPISDIIPNHLTNHKSLNQLISTASIAGDPTVVQFDPGGGQLFKLPLSPPAVSLPTSVQPSNAVVSPPHIHETL